MLGAVTTSWIVIKKPDLSMMLNGVIAALVAITAACGIRGAVGRDRDRLRRRRRSPSSASLCVERIGIDDPVGAVAAHGMSGVWGTLALGFFAVPALAEKLATGTGGLVLRGGLHQLGVQALGLVAVGAFTFAASFAIALDS